MNKIRRATEKDMRGDNAEWFRGLSTFQLSACNNLFHSIRDDLEQGSTYRVRECLKDMGLEPVTSSKNIKTIMNLCIGNDLAFLYFLWESTYKTPGNGYNANEQIIMSSICHLDMIMTLRELDRVLPPGHLSKKDQIKYEAQQLRDELSKRRRTITTVETKPDYVLPYFERNTRPKPFGTPLYAFPPELTVNFNFYDNATNPLYVIPNEYRWFAYYELQPAKRIVKSILGEEIDRVLLGPFDAHHDTSSDLCATHKVLKEIEERLKDELKVLARDRCLQLLTKFDKKGKAKKLLEQFRREVDNQVCNLQKFRRIELMNINTLEGGSSCKLCEHFINISDTNFTEVKATVNDLGLVEEIKHRSSDSEDNDNKKQTSIGNCKEQRRRDGPVSFDNCVDIRIEDFTDQKQLKNNANQRYFVPPTINKPHHFDYRRVFYNKPCDVKSHITDYCIEAIKTGENNSRSDSTICSLIEDDRHKIVNAIVKCARKIWRQRLAIWKVVDEENQRLEEERRLLSEQVVQYNTNYFDPNDKKLMDRMLEDAFKLIKKNPKFVLASFPDSHKLPELREWIAKRYGKKYNAEEVEKIIKSSADVVTKLPSFKAKNVPHPNKFPSHLRLNLSYNKRNAALIAAKEIKEKYYSVLNKSLMKNTRIFWFALSPYICSTSPPRNTFFAYMPAHEKTITRHRLWRSSETRHIRVQQTHKSAAV